MYHGIYQQIQISHDGTTDNYIYIVGGQNYKTVMSRYNLSESMLVSSFYDYGINYWQCME